MSQKSTLCKFAVLWLLLPGLVAPMRLCAQSEFLPHARKAFRTTSSVSWILKETFDATGYDNGTTVWTEAGGGTKNEDYTTTVLYGTQSFYLSASANAPESRAAITTSGPTDSCFMMQISSLPPTSTFTIHRLRNGTSTLASLGVTTGGALTVQATGGTAATTSDVLSTNTTYYIFLTHTAGNPSSYTVGFSTDGTRPTSGNKYAACTNGGSSSQPDQWNLGSSTSNTGTFLFDNLFIDDATISSAPTP